MNNNTKLSEYRTKCPIKMSDGRIFTDYRPRCAVNADLMTDLSNNSMIKSSYESRVFLQNNAEKIIEMNKMNATNNLAPCAPCSRPIDVSGSNCSFQKVVLLNLNFLSYQYGFVAFAYNDHFLNSKI